jgi:hypothetical protein
MVMSWFLIQRHSPGAFAEQVSGSDYTLVCRADSLATALSSM